MNYRYAALGMVLALTSCTFDTSSTPLDEFGADDPQGEAAGPDASSVVEEEPDAAGEVDAAPTPEPDPISPDASDEDSHHGPHGGMGGH